MADTDPAALLAGWREAARASTEPDDVAFLTLAADAMPLLVAAVERLSELAGDWDREAARLETSADRDRSASAGQRTRQITRAQARRDGAKALREAITAALTGTQLGSSSDEH